RASTSPSYFLRRRTQSLPTGKPHVSLDRRCHSHRLPHGNGGRPKSRRSTVRKESCATLRATVPANEPAPAAMSGLVWNSETPWVATSTARIDADSASAENPLNQLTNFLSMAACCAAVLFRCFALPLIVL